MNPIPFLTLALIAFKLPDLIRALREPQPVRTVSRSTGADGFEVDVQAGTGSNKWATQAELRRLTEELNATTRLVTGLTPEALFTAEQQVKRQIRGAQLLAQQSAQGAAPVSPNPALVTVTFEANNPDDHTRTSTNLKGTPQAVLDAIEQLYGVSRVNEIRREWGFQPKPASPEVQTELPQPVPAAQAEMGSIEWATQIRQKFQSLCEGAEIRQPSPSPS